MVLNRTVSETRKVISWNKAFSRVIKTLRLIFSTTFFMPYKLCSCISFLILALVPMSCVCFLKLTLSPKRKPRKPTFSVLLSRICLNKHRSCIPCMKWHYHMTPLAAFLHCPSHAWGPPFSLATCVNRKLQV